MVKDLNKQLLANILYINEINDFFYKNWEKLIKTNQLITDKWKDQLKNFKNE